MNSRTAETASGQRAQWWRSQRNTFGLPDRLYSPLPFAVIAVTALGVGGGFLSLLLMAAMHGTIGALAGGLAAIVRSLIVRLRR